MNVRFGKCASCGAEYKVPASFQHDMARCKECGGVTHFGPAQAPGEDPKFPAAALGSAGGGADARQKPAAPSPKPAPAAVPKPAPAPMPARKIAPKPTPPRAKPQPKATTPAKPTPPARTPKPAAPQASPGKSTPRKATPGKVAPSAAAPKAAAPRAAAPKAAAAGGSMLERLKAQRAAESQPAAEPARTPGRKSAAKTAAPAAAKPGRTRPAAGRRGAARNRKNDDDDETENAGRSRRGSRAAKKSPLPALLGVAGLVIAGGVAWYLLTGDDAVTPGSDVAAAGDEMAADGTPAAGETPADDAGETDAASEAGTDAAELGTVADAFEGVDPADDAEASKKKTKKITLAMQDPAATDLSVFDFGPVFDTTDAEWEQMNEWMAAWMDPYAGAAGTRARDKLIAMDIKAIPVILNTMTELDLGTEEGHANGDLAQKELTNLLAQKNYGWEYPKRDAEDPALDANRVHVYNKKVVKKYATTWQSVVDEGIEAFIRFTELEKKDEARAQTLRKLYGSAVTPKVDGLEAPAPMDDDIFDVD